MKTHTFTPEDFAKFKAKVQSLLDAFGMYEWNITISQEQIGDRVNAQATYNNNTKNAIIRLTINAEGDFGMVWDVEKLAVHEVLHLLLADWCETAAELKSATHTLVVGQEHAVLNRLMRVIK